MKNLLSSRHLFLLGFAILIVTNIFVLSGIAYNRKGDPDARITLTERELKMPNWGRKENSGLALKLSWRTLSRNSYESYNHDNHSPAWLNTKKLRELGFYIEDRDYLENNFDKYKHTIPKEVFIVLENESSTHQKALSKVEAVVKRKKEALLKLNNKEMRDELKRAEERLTREQISASRLFAIDAGLDPDVLRREYSDQTRYIITKGLVKPSSPYKKKMKEVFGYIKKLSIERIHVPLKHRKLFDTILDSRKQNRPDNHPPRYKIELAYGSHLEPWIISVQPLNDQ